MNRQPSPPTICGVTKADRPEVSFVVGVVLGFIGMAVFVAALLAGQFRSGFYGVTAEPLPHAMPEWKGP